MTALLATLSVTAQEFTQLLEELSSPEGIEHLFYRHGWRTLIDDAVFQDLDAARSACAALSAPLQR